MFWYQRSLELPPRRRGFHLITSKIVDALPELTHLRVGQLQVFLQHTSAALTINENADPDVRVDLERFLNAAVPENFSYTHTLEGPDDMPAHVKSSLLGCSLLLPVQEGRLALGVWQGIYLCEHRDRGGPRRLLLTLFGQLRAD